MATEASTGTEIVSLATPDHDDLTSSTTTAIQDASSREPSLINGVHDANSKEEEQPQQQQQESEPSSGDVNAAADAGPGGGSDTEASKAVETSKEHDDKSHVRSNSTVKKPTTFKSVSVNKTFLAARPGSISSGSGRPGDKSVGSTPDLGSTSPIPARPRLIAKTGSGLRDSQARSSISGAGAKPGAAPDASAVWNKNRPAPPPDTKRFTDEELKQRYGIHLATRLQADDPGKQATWADIDDDDDDWVPETIEWTDGTKITLPTAEELPPPTPEPAPVAVVKFEASQPPISPKQVVSTPAVATTKTSGLSSGRTGLVLKAATEKPTLVAKPPGPPAPVKSPWATLPPVEKVAPVDVNTPQQQQGRFQPRDPHGFQGMPPAAQATQIAADDFSRNWRDSNGPTSKELFNSQSGRYEPVGDNRRMGRQDARLPAVLQRGAADGSVDSSGTHGAYGRRRASSNLSGGSSNFIRRMSRGIDMPAPHMRRGSNMDSTEEPAAEGPDSHQDVQGTSASKGRGAWQNARTPSGSAEAQHQPAPTNVDEQGPADAPVQPPGPTQEELVQQQKLMMQQKREEARKRKQEEEAAEEAAKQERIRAKLAAMGPAPESRSSKKDAKESTKNDPPAPVQIQQRKAESANGSDEGQKTAPSEKQNTAPPVKTLLEHGSQLPAAQAGTKPQVNGHITAAAPEARTSSAETNAPAQSWQSNATSVPARSVWSNGDAQPVSQRNVWASSTPHRALGNGTFDADLNSKLPQAQQPKPAPIGPPSHRVKDQAPSQVHHDPRGRDVLDIGRSRGSRGTGHDHTDMERRFPGDTNAHLTESQPSHLHREPQTRGEGPTQSDDKWRRAAKDAEDPRSVSDAAINHISSHQQPPHDNPTQSEHAPASIIQRHVMDDTWKLGAGAQATTIPRGSRFFPTRDIRLEEPSVTPDRSGSPPPPPPTMSGHHPAYDGDSRHPHVALPRPSPVVKLPPPAPVAPPKPINFAAALAGPAPPPAPSAPRPTVASRSSMVQDVRRSEPMSAGDWQSKIDNLMRRKVSPGMHTLTVDSLSKHALDIRAQSGLTVSLPAKELDLKYDAQTFAVSKTTAEDCFEEPEMGSTPPVRIPNKMPLAALLPVETPRPLHVRFFVDAVSMMQLPEELHMSNGKVDIRLPGMNAKKEIILANSPRGGANRRGNMHRGSPRHTSSGGYRGGKQRDISAPHHTGTMDRPTTPSGPAHGGRGRGRGHNNAPRSASNLTVGGA